MSARDEQGIAEELADRAVVMAAAEAIIDARMASPNDPPGGSAVLYAKAAITALLASPEFAQIIARKQAEALREAGLYRRAAALAEDAR